MTNATSDSTIKGGSDNQVKAGSDSKVALYFGSMASGPIGDEFLKTWLIDYARKEKVTLTADKYSACGKEGEYIIVIHKDGLGTRENAFDQALATVIASEVQRTKAANPSSGSVEIRPEPEVAEYSYCRLGMKKWL